MSTLRPLLLVLVVLTTCLVACESRQVAPPEASPDAATAAPTDTPDAATTPDVTPEPEDMDKPGKAPEPPAPAFDPHTTELLGKLDAVRDGIANKKLEAALAATTWLAANPAHKELPDTTKKDAQAYAKATKKLAGAKRLDQMAPLFAATTETCGGCHATAGEQVSFAQAALPDLDGVAKAQMDRHDWATRRLFEAMVARNGELWSSGASILGEESIHGVTPAEDPSLKPLFKKWKMLSDKASKEEHWGHRADFYGQYLQACVSCHDKAREIKP